MAINAATVDSQMELCLMHGEKIFCKNVNVRLVLESGGGYPGAGGSYSSPSGDVYLTNFRTVYIVNPTMQHFKNVDIPLPNMFHAALVKPYFGSPNTVTADIAPVPGRGLVGRMAQLSLTFLSGGAVEFHSLYLHALSYQNSSVPLGPPPEDQLPVYSAETPDHATVMASTSSTQRPDPEHVSADVQEPPPPPFSE